jgi:hypothetical protein
MKQDEIIEMARQADATKIGHKPIAFHFYMEQLEVFAKLVAAKEREACAKLCEESSHPFGYANLTAEVCAKAIRARGEA